MDGKVVLLTRSHLGFGEAAATRSPPLAPASGWWCAVASAACTRARIIEKTGSDDVHVGIRDLADLRSVRRFSDQFAAGRAGSTYWCTTPACSQRTARCRTTASS